MARPDIKGTVIDTDGAADGGGANGPENEPGAENLDALNEPGAGADDNGGGEDSPDGEAAGGMEDAAGGAGEGAEPGPVDNGAFTPEAREQFRAQLREELRSEIMEEMKANQPPTPAKEISDEEWVKHEAEWGIPRTAIKATVSRMERVVNHVMQKMDERFAKFEKGDALRTLSQEKGFNDISRYQKDIDDFLGRYHPKHHSNPDLLKQAVFYARGKNMPSAVKRAATGAERNRKISGIARPASAAGPQGKNGALKRALTPIERSAARAANMSDQAYLEAKSQRRVLT